MRVYDRMCLIFALSASVSAAAGRQWCEANRQPTDCNGISVGMPKVFDNRSLTLQIEALEQALQRQQAANPSIDLKSVIGALANTQGLTQSELSTVLSVLGNPTPTKGVTTDTKTGNVDANGNPLPNTTDSQITKNVASATPTAPTFDSFASVPSGFNPPFGSSASDLLNDQVDLSYQIMNLQMILERALSDRLYSDCVDPNGNCTRLQTVVGFNVTIDPPRVANDAVAVVEITLTRSDKQGHGPDSDLSLVAMMPQEKTYNSAALSSSSHAYSGAAVVNAFQVSGGYRKRNQTFYVYRDTDTLSYERMTKDGELIFGWMFRPVLGRHSISPGLRQLFAVISLPNIDCDSQDTANANKPGEGSKKSCSIGLTPKVRSYWKKFDRATQTSFEKHDANRASKIWYALSAGLSRPQIFNETNESYLNEFEYNTLRVHSSAYYEDALRPVIHDVTWTPTGQKSVIVSVTGRNFFTDTQVKLGDTIYSEANKNLIIKSEQSLDVITTFDQLGSGPSSILGRYGTSKPLLASSPPDMPEAIKYGFQIQKAGLKIGPSIDGYRTMELPLGQRFDTNPNYSNAKKSIADLQNQLSDWAKILRTTESELAPKKQALATLQAAKKPNATQVAQLQSEIATLNDTLSRAQISQEKTLTNLDQAKSAYVHDYSLRRNALLESQLPIVSVNGTALRLPYAISDVPQNQERLTPGYVLIKTTFPDSLITNGAALIQVSWPFYDPALWTDTLQYTGPDDEFKVDRVSANTVVIRREGKIGFFPKADLNGNLIPGRDNACWKFVAGDTSADLPTQYCTYQPKPTPTAVKGQPAPKPDSAPRFRKPNSSLPSRLVIRNHFPLMWYFSIPTFPFTT